MEIFITNIEQVCPKGIYLARVSPRYSFTNGERGKELEGYNYIVASRNGFDKITIKTNDKVPKMTQEALEASKNDVSVTVKGFQATVYNVDGKAGISATAKKVILS